MTKLATSWARRQGHQGGAFELLWTLVCWAAAFSAVVVTTAFLVR